MSFTTILVARHGQTEFNRQGGKIQGGQSDGPLNQLNNEGREQALKLAKFMLDKLRDTEIAAFYSSDLGRARETSQIVKDQYVAANKFQGNIRINSNFDEMRHGPHEGMPTELWNKYAKEFFATLWLNDPQKGLKWRVTPFNGEETNQELFDRLFKGMKQVADENPGKTVFVCSHGAAISTLRIWCETAEGDDLKHYTEMSAIANCTIAKFEYHPTAPLQKDRLKFIKIVSENTLRDLVGVSANS